MKVISFFLKLFESSFDSTFINFYIFGDDYVCGVDMQNSSTAPQSNFSKITTHLNDNLSKIVNSVIFIWREFVAGPLYLTALVLASDTYLKLVVCLCF